MQEMVSLTPLLDLTSSIKNKVKKFEDGISKVRDNVIDSGVLRVVTKTYEGGSIAAIEALKTENLHLNKVVNRDIPLSYKTETKEYEPTSLKDIAIAMIKKTANKSNTMYLNKIYGISGGAKSDSLDYNRELINYDRHNEKLSRLNEVNNTIGKLVGFNNDIADKYYRKSLEMQYLSYFTIKEQLAVTRLAGQLTHSQLEAIVKNTSIPDNLKRSLDIVRGMKEIVKERAIATTREIFNSLIGNAEDKLFESFKHGMKSMVDKSATDDKGSGEESIRHKLDELKKKARLDKDSVDSLSEELKEARGTIATFKYGANELVKDFLYRKGDEEKAGIKCDKLCKSVTVTIPEILNKIYEQLSGNTTSDVKQSVTNINNNTNKHLHTTNVTNSKTNVQNISDNSKHVSKSLVKHNISNNDIKRELTYIINGNKTNKKSLKKDIDAYRERLKDNMPDVDVDGMMGWITEKIDTGVEEVKNKTSAVDTRAIYDHVDSVVKAYVKDKEPTLANISNTATDKLVKAKNTYTTAKDGIDVQSYIDSLIARAGKLKERAAISTPNLGNSVNRIKSMLPDTETVMSSKQSITDSIRDKSGKVLDAANRFSKDTIDYVTSSNARSKINTVRISPTDEELENLRLAYFSSKEYALGHVKTFEEYLKSFNIEIDSDNIKKNILSKVTLLSKPLGLVKGKIGESAAKASQFIKDRLNPMLTTLNKEDEETLKQEFFRSKEYAMGYVTDFKQYMKSLGFRPQIFTKDNIRKLLEKTRAIDRKIMSGVGRGIVGGVKLAGKALRYGPGAVYQGAKFGVEATGLALESVGKAVTGYDTWRKSDKVQEKVSKTKAKSGSLGKAIASATGELGKDTVVTSAKGIALTVESVMKQLSGYDVLKKKFGKSDSDEPRAGGWQARLKDIEVKNAEEAPKKSLKQFIKDNKTLSTTGMLLALVGIGKALGVTMEDVKGFISGVGKGISTVVNVLGNVYNAIKTVASTISDAIGSVLKTILPTKLFNKLANFFGVGDSTTEDGGSTSSGGIGVGEIAGYGVAAAGTMYAGKKIANVAGSVAKPLTSAASAVGSAASKTGMIDSIKASLGRLKDVVTKKAGKKGAALLTSKITSRLIPGAGLALLAYDASKISYDMAVNDTPFDVAVSNQILGFNIFEETTSDTHAVNETDKQQQQQHTSYVDKAKTNISSLATAAKEKFSYAYDYGKEVGKGVATTLAKGFAAVKDTIFNASEEAGVPASTMTKFAQVESNFNPNAQAKTSSAGGMYQFIDSTWKDMINKHGDKYGLSKDTSKFDPRASTLMGAEYVKQNANILGKNGVPATDGNLYLTHFLGPGGVKLLKADPSQPASSLFPAAAKANQQVFYTNTGNPKTVGDVISWANKKMNIDVSQLTTSSAVNNVTDTTTSGTSSLPSLATNVSTTQTISQDKTLANAPENFIKEDKKLAMRDELHSKKLDSLIQPTNLNSDLNRISNDLLSSIDETLKTSLDIQRMTLIAIGKLSTASKTTEDDKQQQASKPIATKPVFREDIPLPAINLSRKIPNMKSAI